MTDQDLDLDHLEALANAATEGPWEADCTEVSQHWSRPEPWHTVSSSEVDCGSYCYGGSARGIERVEDAEFIASSRTAVPALIAEVLRLRAQVEQVKAEAWDEGNLAAYPLQLAVGQFIDNGGDVWGNLDDAYEQVSAAPNPYRKDDYNE